MWAPGRIPADTVCDSLASTIDLLPTIAALTNTPLPDDRSIDGVDISSLLFGGAKSPREEFLYFNNGGLLEGIRIGDWKLLLKQPKGKQDGELAKSEVMLFDLAGDLGERSNLAAAKPDIVERLRLRCSLGNIDRRPKTQDLFIGWG